MWCTGQLARGLRVKETRHLGVKSQFRAERKPWQPSPCTDATQCFSLALRRASLPLVLCPEPLQAEWRLPKTPWAQSKSALGPSSTYSHPPQPCGKDSGSAAPARPRPVRQAQFCLYPSCFLYIYHPWGCPHLASDPPGLWNTIPSHVHSLRTGFLVLLMLGDSD